MNDLFDSIVSEALLTNGNIHLIAERLDIPKAELCLKICTNLDLRTRIFDALRTNMALNTYNTLFNLNMQINDGLSKLDPNNAINAMIRMIDMFNGLTGYVPTMAGAGGPSEGVVNMTDIIEQAEQVLQQSVDTDDSGTGTDLT